MKIPDISLERDPASTRIPTWIKDNAGLWSNGKINDDTSVQGIQWLITNGVMKIN